MKGPGKTDNDYLGIVVALARRSARDSHSTLASPSDATDDIVIGYVYKPPPPSLDKPSEMPLPVAIRPGETPSISILSDLLTTIKNLG